MKRDELYLALTEIDERFIEETANDIQRGKRRIQPAFLRLAALAACMVLVFSLPFLWMSLTPMKKGAVAGGAPLEAAITDSQADTAEDDTAEEAPPEAEPAEILPAAPEVQDSTNYGTSEEKSQMAAAQPWIGIQRAVSLTIQNSSGEEAEADPQTLDELRHHLLIARCKPGAEYNDHDFLYLLDWYDEDGVRLERITVLDDLTLVYGGTQYLPTRDMVLDLDDIAFLFDR